MRSTRASSIGAKILLRSVAASLVPLLVLATAAFVGLSQLNAEAGRLVDRSRQDLESRSVLVNAEGRAAAVTEQINVVLLQRINDVQAWARSPQVVDGAVEAGRYARDEGLVELTAEQLERRFAETKSTRQALDARAFLLNELSKNPDFGDISFTDANGYNAAVTDQTGDFIQSDEDWWKAAWNKGIEIGEPELDESNGRVSVEIAVRIVDQRSGARLGVLRTTLDASFVDSIVDQRATDDVEYSVALADGRLIADTGSNGRSPEEPGARAEGLTAAVEGGGTGSLVGDVWVHGYDRTIDPAFFSSAVAGFGGFDWVVVASETVDSAYAPLEGLQDLRTNVEAASDDFRTIMIVVLVAALGLAIVMARFMARDVTVPIRTLTGAASEAAATNLPRAVDEINESGADIDSVAVPEVQIATGDELEELAHSFNSVQKVAVDLAGRQAVSRRNTAEMFVNLGRRNQSLLKRQLRFIDELERNEADPETLEALFRLDHLATRMRRNAESLLVMAGDRSPRRWAAPVPIGDGIEAALAEVEGYDRVEVAEVEETSVQGNAVADIAHILAELIENALTFSPPHSEVTVEGRRLGAGYAITVTDHGFGMREDELATANAALSTVHALSDVPTRQLGHFVVARLADRYGVTVTLIPAPTGGLTARVELPEGLLAGGATMADERLGAAPTTGRAASTPVGSATPTDPAPAGEPAHDQEPVRADAGPAPAEAVPGDRRGTGAPTAVEPESADPAPRPDEEPGGSEAVDVGGLSFPRRRATGPETSEQTPAQGGPHDSSPSATPAAPGLAGGRRSDDPAPGQSAPDPGSDGGPDLARYGFTRRASQRDDAEPDDAGRPAPADAPAPAGADAPGPAERPASEDEAVLTAEHSRHRWSRFQRGKEDARTADDPAGEA